MPDDIIVTSPLYPVANPAWLYVPRSTIVVPTGAPPPTETWYVLAEDSDDISLEDSSGWLLLESYQESIENG